MAVESELLIDGDHLAHLFAANPIETNRIQPGNKKHCARTFFGGGTSTVARGEEGEKVGEE